MYCSKCGTMMPDDASYCSTCGYKLNGQSNEQQSTLNSNSINFESQKDILSKQGLLYISGRRNRKPFIYIHLVLTLVISILVTIPSIRYLSDTLLFLLLIMLLVTGYMVAVNLGKRMHDINKPGYIPLVLLFITAISVFSRSRTMIDFLELIILPLIIFLMIKKGTDGPNKYGDDPLKTKD